MSDGNIPHSQRPSKQGFTLISISVSLAGSIALLALAGDLGRGYIAKIEARTFAADSSLEGALELDDDAAGIFRAQNKILSNNNRWNLDSKTVPASSIAFVQSKSGPWDSVVIAPRGYRCVRVIAEASPQFKRDNVCPADNQQSTIDLAQAGGGDGRGYIEAISAAVIGDIIVFNSQTIQRVIEETVVMTGGAKQTILGALIVRVKQDSGAQSVTLFDCVTCNTGNGRLVGAPINTGRPDYRIVHKSAPNRNTTRAAINPSAPNISAPGPSPTNRRPSRPPVLSL